MIRTMTIVAAIAVGTAASAQGVPGGYGYPGGGGGTQSTRCESNNGRTQRCALDTSRGVTISRVYSDSPCVQGRSWGYDRGGIWVSNGCRAAFIANGIGGGYPGGGGNAGRQVIQCESRGNDRQRCDANVDRGVRLVENLSRTDCVEGRNWGWDRRGVWVSNGCRGRFAVR